MHARHWMLQPVSTAAEVGVQKKGSELFPRLAATAVLSDNYRSCKERSKGCGLSEELMSGEHSLARQSCLVRHTTFFCLIIRLPGLDLLVAEFSCTSCSHSAQL